MKRYDLYSHDDQSNFRYANYPIPEEGGQWVDAHIAQELYDHLKHVVDKARDFIDDEVLDGSDNDFDQWFLSACKTLEKADKD